MAYLASPAATMQIIKKYGFSIQKRYGQNFLIDRNIVERIVDCAGITGEDSIIEIGPGIGTMTQYLAERAGQVTAVEIDKELIPVLDDTLSEYNNVTVINGDILKMNLRQLVQDKNGGRPIKVVANLPYYITTPVIMELLESHAPISGITLMVQKEVAARMQAGPGTKDYGALSLAVQYYARPEVIINVSPSCFFPRPGVGSAVVHLTGYGNLPVQAENEKQLFSFIRAAFNQRRKTLANALANSSSLIGRDGRTVKITRQEVCNALLKMGLSQTIRGEALTLEEFAVLCSFF